MSRLGLSPPPPPPVLSPPCMPLPPSRAPSRVSVPLPSRVSVPLPAATTTQPSFWSPPIAQVAPAHSSVHATMNAAVGLRFASGSGGSAHGAAVADASVALGYYGANRWAVHRWGWLKRIASKGGWGGRAGEVRQQPACLRTCMRARPRPCCTDPRPPPLCRLAAAAAAAPHRQPLPPANPQPNPTHTCTSTSTS